MRLPDGTARAATVAQHIRVAPPPFDEADVAQSVASTDEFTGEDLTRTTEDCWALEAFERVARNGRMAVTDYYLWPHRPSNGLRDCSDQASVAFGASTNELLLGCPWAMSFLISRAVVRERSDRLSEKPRRLVSW